jgi:hypothetical protein
MPPLQPREQPHPYAFLVDARHFFNAAVLVTGEVRDGIPVVHRGFVPYFLLSHSIELILKAWLLANGHDVADLASKKKGFSHNLLGLLAAARPHGLDCLGGFDPAAIDRLVSLLSGPHDRRDFGYHVTWRALQLPHLDQALADSRALLDAVSAVCPRP